jgi:cholesterol transport system auxiliary component
MAAATLCAAALCGCVSGAFDSDQPYQQVYVFAPPAMPAAGGEALAADLIVARPVVRPGIDNDRIAVRYPDHRLDYFARSRWGGTTGSVVQTLLVESLRGSGRFRTVQGDVAPFGGQYLLQAELTDFQAEYPTAGGPPQAHVALVVTLGRVSSGAPLASFASTASVPAADNSLRAVVAAFEAAYGEVARDTVSRTLAVVSQAEGERSQATQHE